MNANAIYSKSGKGVQEASGKTSHLSRPDRAVLSAIDGRATLADIAQKVGKTFDPAFEKLIETLDKGGFIREVSAGSAAPAKPGAAKPAAGKPAGSGPLEPASDLDFTSFSTPKSKATPPPPPQAPPRAAPPPRQAATIPPPPPPPSAAEKAKADQVAKQQQDAMARAREEAEKKAQAERDRVKAETEAKMRAETEAKMRAEAKEAADKKFAAELEAKHKAEADAKVKAAQAAAAKVAAEAKAKADAEAKKAREEAERVRKEAEEKLRREQEEMQRKLEQERKAREEAERKAKEEAKRIEEERRKLEEERKAREEERRREEEERAARRKQEEEEEKERKRKKREAEEEEERREAAERAERRKREEEEEKERKRKKREAEEEEERQAAAEKEARRKAREQEESSLPEISLPKAAPKAKEPEPAPKAAAGGGGFSDSLLADLESFSTNDEREQKEREEKERKEKEAAAQRAREAEERRQKEEAERAEREEKERRKREEKERKAQEEAELREREEKEKQRLKDEEEKRKKEAEEREKKAKQEESLAAKSTRQAGFDAEQRSKRERDLMARPVRAAGSHRIERKGGFGKTIGIGLFLVILIALGVAHVIPLDVGPYQTAASEALRRPVKIGSANLSLFSGLQLKFSDVSVGDTRIGQVRAHPSIGAITGPKKDFSLLELDGLKIDQQGVGEALFTRMKGDNFSVARIVARKLELTGPLVLPKDLEGDLSFDAEGSLRQGFLRGPETLLAKFAPKGQSVEFDMSAQSFNVPFAPDIAFGQFSMKGTATPQGLSIAEWDGQILNGKLSGTANVRWNEGWVVDGVMTARGINAAVFAPALLSDGRAEGSGKFSMRGADPGKLADTSRIDGSFTVNRGVLGSIDLSRAIQTQGRFGTGRTQFNEMNGQATYDRGAVSLRNVSISAGQLNAGASADIAQNGALTGRIVAEVKIAQQHLRATLNLGGTVKDPQVKN